MGKMFSRPALIAAPRLGSTEGPSSPVAVPRSSFQRDPPTRRNTSVYGSASRQRITLDPIPSLGASNVDISTTNNPFSDFDATTCNENGRSPISTHGQTKEPPPGRTRAFSFDSRFSEIHPDTGKEVFRWGSSGEKHAVKIVCDGLLDVLGRATAGHGLHQDMDSSFAHTGWIKEPYELIVHNKDEIQRLRSALEDGDAKRHLDWFLGFLEFHQPGVWEKYDEVQSRSCHTISFEHLWLLYPPQTTVFKVDNKEWRAYVIEKCETVINTRTTTMRIYAWSLDFNTSGDRLVPHATTFEVPSFVSEQPIRMLELIPEWSVQPTDSLRKQLVGRGELHWGYRGEYFHKRYIGDAWPQGPHQSPAKVIVDYSTSTRCAMPNDVNSRQRSIPCCSECIGDSIGLYSYPRGVSSSSQICVNRTSQTSMSPEEFPPEGYNAFLFCPPKLWAFSLRFKTWKMVAHHHLEAVYPEPTSFDELYMEDVKHKDLLENIVSTYMTEDRITSSTESTGRKGRGLNILMVGTSGTGKTFAAECLSRKFGAALYVVNCGDLGVQSDALDERLLETFTRALNWKAMVLLDDVDVLGYDRSGHRYKRAALVPTFLRHLEYSECLTFITMASVENADPALESRIQAAVPFPRFNIQSQKSLWRLFIERLALDLAAEKSLIANIERGLHQWDDGKHTQMNAWQIRNCIDVALLLARKEAPGDAGQNLTAKHIERVLALGEAFRAHALQEKNESIQANNDSLVNNPANMSRNWLH